MRTADVSTFFAILSLVAWAGTVLSLAVVLVDRFRPVDALVPVADALRDNALWLAWVVAAFATAGSLYLSEVAHFIPCPLCWYQRIAMYPMAVILLVAAVRRDLPSRWYVLPQLVVGAAIAVYHTLLQAYPDHSSPFCTTTEPCTVRYVWKFGFVSIPFMALAAFAFCIVMVSIARVGAPEPEDADQTVGGGVADDPTGAAESAVEPLPTGAR